MTTKQIKGSLLALSAVFLLAGCDAIEAKPTNYEDAIVTKDGKDADLYQNTMGEIWDAITTAKNDRILEEFLKIITKDQFGSYDEIEAAVVSKEAAKAFIAKHKIYVRDNDAELATKFAGYTADDVQYDRLLAFKEDLDKRINEAFYNEIKSGTYTKDNIFYEERLAWAHYTELYGIDLTHDDWIESYITPELKKEDVSSFIHLDGRYDDYINRKILPTILKDKLVEEYIYENNYSTLGRAYARKVNVIKLTREEKYESVPRNMMEKYVETRVDVANAEIDFEELANAWRGFSGLTSNGLIADPSDATLPAESSSIDCNILSPEELVIAEAGGLETGTAVIKSADGLVEQEIVYYKNTKLGILLEKYNKITPEAEKNRWVDEETSQAISEFTNSNAYPKEVGLRNKLAELAVTDYTNDGWFVKNGSLDLPEALKSRLFNITVSNNVDKLQPESDTVKYDKKNYVRNIQGNYFLTPATSDKEAKYNYVINDSDNYYLVEVLEAPATSKLKMDIESDTSYINLKNAEGPLFTEGVAMEIAKVLGTKDSYINNAYQSYIEKYAIEYHDQALYDFFKERYPDLFESK